MALDSRIVLLIGADTAIADESSYHRTLTAVGNAARTTAQAKYGAASLTFDGTGDRVTAADNTAWLFGTGDFTVEGWFRFLVKTTSQTLVSQWSNVNGLQSWALYSAGGQLTFRIGPGSSPVDVLATWTPTLGQWYHLAVDRSGTTVRLYVNGAVVASNAAVSASILDSSEPLVLGALDNLNTFPTFDFNGQMDEVRITKGLAQYAGAFTPPTGPFPRDSLVTVPNVVGLTEAAATTAITAAGLTKGTVTTAPHATVPAGSVVSQVPAAGGTATPGSAVALTVSTGPANAWDLTIAGVSQKSKLIASAGVSIRLESSERATLRAVLRRVGGYLPARFDPVLVYDKSGALMYGGIILSREADAEVPTLQTVTISCVDWWVYLDWALVTLTFTAPITTKGVLTALLAALPSSYGFTVAASQANGLTYETYSSGVNVKASDVLRNLARDLGWRPDVSPAKVLAIVAPGSAAAPYSITTAAPHCQHAQWMDPTGTPANHVVLTCGPAGVGAEINHHWVGNASHAYALAGVAVPASSVFPGICFVDGVQFPIWQPGAGPTDRIEWDYALNGGTLKFMGAAFAYDTVGADIEINYAPQFPFTVEADAGLSPVISEVFHDESIIVYEQGITRAAAILAERNQSAARELAIVSQADGWRPDQTVSVDLAVLAFSGNCTIGAVDIRLQLNDLWQYQFTAVETSIVPGSALDIWRKLIGTGGGGSGSAGTTIGGGATGPPGPAGPTGPAGPPGAVSGLPALSPGYVFVGNASSVAAPVPMSGDVTMAASGAATVVHVVNSATTATEFVAANTIMSRNAAGDSSSHSFFVADTFSGPVLTASADLHINAAANVWIDPAAGSIALQPQVYLYLAPASKATIPFVGYTQNIGMLTNKFLTIHAAELWVESLVAQQTIATIGGRVLVAPTTILARDLAPADAVMYVKHNAFKLHVPGVELGSKLVMQSAGKYESFAVTAAAVPAAETDGSYGYPVNRNLDGSGANQWYAGDAVLDTGKSDTTSGIIDLYAVSGLLPGTGIGPAIVGNVRTGINHSDLAPRWAIGNLNGTYGYSTDIFGAAFGVPAGAWVKIDPTNGVRIGFNTTDKIRLDAAGNAFFVGQITAAGGTVGGWSILPGYLYAPAISTSIAFNSSAPSIEIGNPRPQGYADGNPGIWMGNDGGVYKFRASNAGASAGFFWDGVTATFRGDAGGATNINGGNIQTDTITATQIAAGAITASEIATDAVTAIKIKAGAVTAGKIAADAVVADNIDVGQLSAISTDIGTITAGTITGNTINGGTINGATIRAGSSMVAGSGNEVSIDNNGITLAAGGFAASRLKWSDGSDLVSGSHNLNIRSGGIGLVCTSVSIDYLSGSGNRYVYVDNGGVLRTAGPIVDLADLEARIVALEGRI